MQTPRLTNIPTLAELQGIHRAIQPLIHRTPVLTCKSIDKIAGAALYFKCENFQKVGAFKMRGAASASLSLSEEDKKNGIATHSSGNHAQAVALSAKLLGIPAYIVMPKNAPSIKRTATLGYGAKVITSGNTIQDRERTLERVVAQTKATFIHPYDNYNVIAGQASCAKELHEDTPDLDVVMSPVGGGGLMSGTALITHYLHPNCEIYGAEPERVNDAYRSFLSGKVEGNDRIDTIADGLRTTLSHKTLEIIRNYVKGIITVSEAEIVAAMRLIWERMKIIVEPSCAVTLAAILKDKEQFAGKKIGLILTGGNVDVEQLPF